MRDVFLSYSRRNKRIVERLVGDLREHHIDVLELAVGDLVHQKIERGIEESRYFCLATSPAALQSYVRQVEFEAAITLQDLKFTGQRWYKGLDISHFGEPVGVGELERMPSLGGSYLITWDAVSSPASTCTSTATRRTTSSSATTRRAGSSRT